MLVSYRFSDSLYIGTTAIRLRFVTRLSTGSLPRPIVSLFTYSFVYETIVHQTYRYSIQNANKPELFRDTSYFSYERC